MNVRYFVGYEFLLEYNKKGIEIALKNKVAVKWLCTVKTDVNKVLGQYFYSNILTIWVNNMPD